ncbi:MAG: zinc-dependent alcohol dehydrogenase family protein [Exilispira sp.]|jgi:propanol-preferring alcohol dehydrogenase|nr:zinc-dependent alcohol dehydrogenase family protein [Exilispira sp.]
MKAMILEKINQPLRLVDLPIPKINEDEILIKVVACGVCRTELDQIAGRIEPPKLPVVLGHQPVGYVEKIGAKVRRFKVGDRVGATWLYSSCGNCKFCNSERENLCQDFKATGCHEDGGYAEFFKISERYAVKIPDEFSKIEEVAPLLCGGVVGYRAIKLANIQNGQNIAIWGFGSSNHQVFQVIKYLYPNSKIFVFTRNIEEQDLARRLKADFVGSLDDKPRERQDIAICTIPIWSALVKALENLDKGGKLIINLIRMQNIDKDALLNLEYSQHLWMEKKIQTVANVTKKDAEEFLIIASKMKLKPEIEFYPLKKANEALTDLKEGRIKGSKVLIVG